MLSAIYASPNPLFRLDLWDYLIGLGVVVNLPWLLIGDFNQIVHHSEKCGGVPTAEVRLRAFQQVIMSCNLIDLGFSGPRFTWSNMRKGLAHVQERLDTVLCNRAWLHKFSVTRVVHLPRTRSDHCPLMVNNRYVARASPLLKPFCLQAAWFLHPQFESFLEQCWKNCGQLDLVHKLLSLKSSCQLWNQRVFGNFFHRKFRCLACLKGVQQALQTRPSTRLHSLEESLRAELEMVLEQEEVFWRQKSRIT